MLNRAPGAGLIEKEPAESISKQSYRFRFINELRAFPLDFGPRASTATESKICAEYLAF